MIGCVVWVVGLSTDTGTFVGVTDTGVLEVGLAVEISIGVVEPDDVTPGTIVVRPLNGRSYDQYFAVQ